MKKIALLFSVIFIAFNLSATNDTVFTQGMSFNPNSLTINIGDTVTFVNNTGVSHNVNGTISTFPSNPESFGNSVSASWTFEHVFTIAGTYNYQCDPHASSMSGQIIVNSPGCTDPTACNYDAAATVDDGSCDLPDGCTDPLFLEYDVNATCDDGSCTTLIVYGCTNNIACNYDATANVDDNSCELPDGCTDITAFNYDPSALCDDGSCVPVVDGCIDPNACNYDANANTNDGSCTYSPTVTVNESYFNNFGVSCNVGIQMDL